MKRLSYLGSVAILSASVMLGKPAQAAIELVEFYADALGVEAAPPRLHLAAISLRTDELSELRGGFSAPSGVSVAFGFDIDTRLGGVSVQRLNMPTSTISPNMPAPMITVTEGENSTQRPFSTAGAPVLFEVMGANGATRVQTMIGNGITSIVQNAANGQQVQRFANITVDVSGMQNMLARAGQNRVMENAIMFRHAIPR